MNSNFPMSTNANPGTLRNKVVCAACRARKKKCDGEQPSCSSCRKRNEQCSYFPPTAGSMPLFGWDQSFPTNPFFLPLLDGAGDGAITSLPGYDGFLPDYVPNPAPQIVLGDSWMTPLPATPRASAPLSSGHEVQALQAPTTYPFFDQGPDVATLEMSTSTKTNTESANLFPAHHHIVQLVDLFFDRYHDYLPLLHRQTFTQAVSTEGLITTSPLLLYSIMAITAQTHPDPAIRSQRNKWFEKAKVLYAATGHAPKQPLETLQAAACILLHALIVSEYSTAWLVLGMAWRQAVAMGFHRIDAASPLNLTDPPPSATDWRELEQRRRIVWVLFMLDRSMCFPIGLTHAIDARKLRIHLPLSDDVFQNVDQPPPPAEPIRHPPTVSTLLGHFESHPTIDVPRTHYLLLAYLLLGAIVEHMYSPEYDLHDAAHESERAALEHDLAQTRLVLPRSATDLSAASYATFKHVVWLNIVMNLNTVLLFHRPSLPNAGSDNSWQLCVAAARNVARVIREASRVSTELLINPHVAAPIFTCGRILVVEYLIPSGAPHAGPGLNGVKTSDPELRADLEVMLLIFDRLGEAFEGVGRKFRLGLLYHLRQELSCVQAIKDGGSRELLTTCGKWPAIPSGDARGIPD
ncbi:fungal-specific transcription factor domain-containing protein [Cercophora scortea]|uniref:Fungal-specific transcription factor domain-containing protein n=1 Tax=Cercophora scortea TaxID=314031 RepID=A0AAE0I6T6_9PEZI|nr:fungal-specific transcription factor domain-containing protein [Cercophora scortea]